MDAAQMHGAELKRAYLDELHADREAYRQQWLSRQLPSRYRMVSPSDLHRGLRSWKADRSVLLTGKPGSGKTHQLVALAKRAHELGHDVSWFDEVSLFDRLRASQRDPELFPTQVMVSKVIAIDDLGKSKVTEWVAERLFLIVNHAYQNERILLVSSELSIEQIGKRASGAIMRRLEEMSGGEDALAPGWWKRGAA